MPSLDRPLCTAAGPGPATELTHLAVAIASKLRDEADVIIPDLNHLLTDVVLGADAALSACPPGEEKNHRICVQVPEPVQEAQGTFVGQAAPGTQTT